VFSLSLFHFINKTKFEFQFKKYKTYGIIWLI
jgi:hypothetical protein